MVIRGLFFAWMLFAAGSDLSVADNVRLLRTPNGGLQPQAVMDGSGTLHLIYFTGEPKGGDLYYVRKLPNTEAFSTPIQVNSRAGSAVAIGTIRGAHLAIGRGGRPHVAWMGSGVVSEEVVGQPYPRHPMLYSRPNDQGTGFEPERNVVTLAWGLDGGGSLAADKKGNVFVAWHGSPPDNQRHEQGRAVFLAHSDNEGEDFKREVRVNPKPTGACGCCGMRAFVDRQDNLYMLYRSADGVSRDMTLLFSYDSGQSFDSTTVNKWQIEACPMSSASFAEGAREVFLGTESRRQVFLSGVERGAKKASITLNKAIGENAKHPSVAVNQDGEILFAWIEGAGWAKGGTLRWQIFDRDGKSIGESGDTQDVPTWSLIAVVATPSSGFVIIY